MIPMLVVVVVVGLGSFLLAAVLAMTMGLATLCTETNEVVCRGDSDVFPITWALAWPECHWVPCRPARQAGRAAIVIASVSQLCPVTDVRLLDCQCFGFVPLRLLPLNLMIISVFLERRPI